MNTAVAETVPAAVPEPHPNLFAWVARNAPALGERPHPA